MTDDRDLVFKNVREALARRDISARAKMPAWDSSVVVCRPPQAFENLTGHFRFKFEAAGGIVVEGFDALAALIVAREVKRGYCDPSVPFVAPTLVIENTFDRARADDYEFGITRATAAIAETGSLILTETDTSSRLAALAPWVHVAVLERSRIAPDMPSAIANFGSDRATLFVTGPSKTADVEGILIKGVHGPGVQICCLV